ncbi:Uncharacterized protein LOK49_LG11G02620 [Camellia lanceoleosa]|uniref:Uncharacterized protein n=1 Tax=Camellia lanceoleosa TaxID=1840588 RepID=A0ACC0FYE7_9ERIC|nr:Uncharacterized protein LOK49_LG11G02620 [Camellia lanceoleosa]
MAGTTGGFAREGSWTDSSDTGVGSEFSEERRSAFYPHEYTPLPSHHPRSGVSLELAEDIWGVGHSLYQNCLVGSVHDIREFNVYLVQSFLDDLWQLAGFMHVIGRSKNVYILSFEHADDLHRVVANGPYAVAGAFFTVDHWRPQLVLEQLVISQAAIWVRLVGLPLECYTSEAGFCLGKAIGEVTQVDVDPLFPRNIRYLRIKVWISLETPLISGFFLKFQDGTHHWIECQYERLCRLCRKCGRIGHTDGQCATPFLEGQHLIQTHLASVAQRLGTRVIHQEGQLMYTSRIRANAHRADRRSTRLARSTTMRHASVLGRARGEGRSIPAHFNHTTSDQDSELVAAHGLVPVQAEDGWPTLETSVPPGVVDNQLQEEGVADIHHPESTQAIDPLPTDPVNSVVELELMWHKWADGLQSLGINAGRLMIDGDPLERMELSHASQLSAAMQMDLVGQSNFVFSDWDNAYQSIPSCGVGCRLNIPYGERHLGQRALVPSGLPERGPSSSGTKPETSCSNGPGTLPPSVDDSLMHALFAGPPLKRRQLGLHQVGVVSYFSEGVSTVEGRCEAESSCISDIGGVSDSVVIVHYGGRGRRKVHRGLVNSKFLSRRTSEDHTPLLSLPLTLH